jgi:hypothetical protein
MKTGRVTGTAATLNVTSVGFRPRKVELFNITGDAFGIWTDGMPDATAMKTIAAGTTALIDTLGVTPLANGFAIGADTDLNVAAENIAWVAYE